MRKLVAILTVLVLALGMAAVISPLNLVHAQGIGYVLSGQQAVTATAAYLTRITYGTVCIKALAGNTINVYLGGAGVTTATGMELTPGNAYCSPTANAAQFYVVASTTGASVSWIVTR